jgi:hypothetical protein
MFRSVITGLFTLALFCVPQLAHGAVLTSCPDCDGDTFALLWNLDSDIAGVSTFDVTLLANTSGNNLGGTALSPLHINAVAISINLPAGSALLANMEFAPNGAANWTAQTGGISSGGGGGCDGNGGFICAQANNLASQALAPSAASATTPYEWTWEISVLDSTPGGAASVFAGSDHDVKVNYSDINGHHVSDNYTFSQGPPPHENAPPVPEPVTSGLVGMGLVSLFFLRRRSRG